MTMDKWLDALYKRNVIRAIDRQFARFIAEQLGEAEAAIVGWSALVSFELGKGNVCVDLQTLDAAKLFDLMPAEASQIALLMQPEQAVILLKASPVVSNGSIPTPLVLNGYRLYLHRYWLAEQSVANHLLSRAEPLDVQDSARPMLDSLFLPDTSLLRHMFPAWQEHEYEEKLTDFFDITQPQKVDFPALISALKRGDDDHRILEFVPDAVRLNWQKVAAASALSYRFAVISGGPGTGKTTTVAKLLAALALSSDKPTGPDIKLVAPTGKAANRLTESIGNAVAALPISEGVRKKIPAQASTIHRLLGAIPNRVEFRHHEGNRLHLDILVVDEASMVDLPLMARLLSALPDHARVILLGDRDQLASVEAGAVLGDICLGAEGVYSVPRVETLSALTGFTLTTDEAAGKLIDGVCLLRKSYRFHALSGIGKLAKAVNEGNAAQLDVVFDQGFTDIAMHNLDNDVYAQAVAQAAAGYSSYLSALKSGAEHRNMLRKYTQVRLLCALSDGPFGVKGLNSAIEKVLVANRLISPGEELFYVGRPIMVTQNDHGLGLYNGDIGIVVEDDDGLRVVFEMADGTVKRFLPSRLPAHQTAYAMTIHKSQGSEFEHTILVLPPLPTPVMTRELVYTGITRAKSKLDLYATRASMTRAVKRKTQRFSGLADALRGC